MFTYYEAKNIIRKCHRSGEEFYNQYRLNRIRLDTVRLMLSTNRIGINCARNLADAFNLPENFRPESFGRGIAS